MTAFGVGKKLDDLKSPPPMVHIEVRAGRTFFQPHQVDNLLFVQKSMHFCNLNSAIMYPPDLIIRELVQASSKSNRIITKIRVLGPSPSNAGTEMLHMPKAGGTASVFKTWCKGLCRLTS